MGKYDAAGKSLLHLYNQAWVEWLLQDRSISVTEELSGEFQFIARSNDSLLKVVGDTGEFLVLTELQFIYDASMPERLATYKLLAYRKYKLKVFVVVIYFLPPPKDETIETAFHDEFMGQTTHVDYHTMKLWELDAEQVLRYDNPMLLPFVPLMKGGETERMVRRCAERIRQEPNEIAAELESILMIFATYIMSVETLREILRLDMTVIEASPLVRELLEQKQVVWFEEGRQEGRQEGHQEGHQEGRREEMQLNIQRVLVLRFGVELEHFEDVLQALNFAAVKHLSEVVFEVETLSKFEEAIKQAQVRFTARNKTTDTTGEIN